MEDELNEEIVAAVLENFGELSIHRGNKLTLFGMETNLTDYGKVKIGM